MGIYPWGSFGSTEKETRIPRITVRCEYPDTALEHTVVSFGLSPRYGLHTPRGRARVVHRPGAGVRGRDGRGRAAVVLVRDGAAGWWWSRTKSSVFNLSVRALGNRII